MPLTHNSRMLRGERDGRGIVSLGIKRERNGLFAAPTVQKYACPVWGMDPVQRKLLRMMQHVLLAQTSRNYISAMPRSVKSAWIRLPATDLSKQASVRT